MGLVASSSLMRGLCRASFDTHTPPCSEYDDEGLFEKNDGGWSFKHWFKLNVYSNTRIRDFVAGYSYKKRVKYLLLIAMLE